jgi:hypothetical protein
MSDDPCKLNSDVAARRVRLQVLSRCLALLLGVCALSIVPQAKAQIEKMQASTVMIQCETPPVPEAGSRWEIADTWRQTIMSSARASAQSCWRMAGKLALAEL